MAVRRLTPRECERLQGFPDDWTLLRMSKRVRKVVEADFAAYMRWKYPDITTAEIQHLAADRPRYRSLGNAMAVPVLLWIGQRIEAVEAALRGKDGVA
jgi:DNA (cytosine-5)-methyltransferase 1